MSADREVFGVLSFADPPPRCRRWGARGRSGDMGMCVGNTSLVGAVRFVLGEARRGRLCVITRFGR